MRPVDAAGFGGTATLTRACVHDFVVSAPDSAWTCGHTKLAGPAHQQKSFLALCFQQRFQLQLVELNDLLLLALDPADKGYDEQLPGRKNEGHGSPVQFEENRQHRGRIEPRQPAEIDVFASLEDVELPDVAVRRCFLTLRRL